MWMRTLVVLWGLGSGGCFAGYAIAAGPTVDTEGTMGVQLGVRLNVGVALSDESAISETIGVQAALPGLTAAAGGPLVGFDYFHYLSDDEVALRGGIRAKVTFGEAEDGFVHSWIGFGGAFAALAELDVPHNQSENHATLGVELEGWYYEDATEERPVDVPGEPLGQFGVNLIFEWFVLDDDPWDW
jgi:hypothetical protein